MDKRGLVSVVTPFYNTEPRFFEEAIASILRQSYSHWELFLVDDGSHSQCREVAKRFCRLVPQQIHYLRHPGGANLGMSASRNLGITAASGEYVAFLDADDVWLSDTLSEQVSILESQPAAAMVYGNTEYWYSWTGREEDRQRDFRPDLGVAPGTLVPPPGLVPLFLAGKGAVPCTCSLLARRRIIADALGGFEDAFQNLYEDQVFYIKLCLRMPVFVAGQSWGRYRQHAGMSTHAALDSRGSANARLTFLRWVYEYLRENGIHDTQVWLPLRQQLWLWGHADHGGPLSAAAHAARRVKKWMLKLQGRLLPQSMQHWLWLRGTFGE
jgi:glycosyltransferase involved in cell wall biosynthesis